MTHQSYIEFNDGSKFAVENFKLLSTKDNEQKLFDENGDAISLHIPEMLKVKFEIDLAGQKYDEAISLLSTGRNFTTVNFEKEFEKEFDSGIGYSNCQACLINKDAASKKAYILCNWIYNESNILTV